jgi:hypothetical protein
VQELLHKTAFTFFTPSRFLTDLNYFLPIFAAGTLVFLQRQVGVRVFAVMLFIFAVPLADYSRWGQMFSLYQLPPQVLEAGNWIQNNTPANTLVDNTGAWMTYLCWREPAHIALPVSEPTAEYHEASERIPQIIAGKRPPDEPGQIIVKIGDVSDNGGKPILWQDDSGAVVLREYP